MFLSDSADPHDRDAGNRHLRFFRYTPMIQPGWTASREKGMQRIDLLREVLADRLKSLNRLDAGESPRSFTRSPRVRDRLGSDPVLAEEVARVRKILDSLPDVRSERVAEVRRKLAEGLAAVPGSVLADKLLQEAILEEIL
jgi:anti-sigma28 factor (negative regulator of flagellin synthesis)